MPKESVATDRAPGAKGPYSQGIAVGDFLFLSGQIYLDPETGALIDGTIEEKTQRVMENLKAILEARGLGLENLVKTTIFLTNMSDFSKVNEAYGRYFKGNPPARSTLEVRALPLGAEIEIEAIAAGI